MVKFNITQINFDFDDAFGQPSEDYKSNLIANVLAQPWEAHDEDDLIDEISNCTGWCIESIAYCETK